MPASVVSRRQVIRSCKARGWTIQPDALEAIEEALADDDSYALSTLLDRLSPHMKDRRTVTVAVWDEFAESHETGNTKVVAAATTDMQVINAFDTPKLVFEVMRKQFQVLCSSNNSNKWSLFGTAEDKVL